jgi:hypothetical protein
MRHIFTLLAMLAPGLALAQSPAPAAPPVAAPEAESVKHDQGAVKTIDVQRGVIICEMPDGPVTYEVGSAQLVDVDGKPQGAAPGSLKAGDKVKVTYEIIAAGPGRGAKASLIRIIK